LGVIFEPVERAIHHSFLPSLLLDVEAVTRELHEMTAHGVKQAGLAIRNPVDSAHWSFEVSKIAVVELVESLTTGIKLSLAQHRRKVCGASMWGCGDRVLSETLA
jgi:hypothetical protein